MCIFLTAYVRWTSGDVLTLKDLKFDGKANLDVEKFNCRIDLANDLAKHTKMTAGYRAESSNELLQDGALEFALTPRRAVPSKAASSPKAIEAA